MAVGQMTAIVSGGNTITGFCRGYDNQLWQMVHTVTDTSVTHGPNTPLAGTLASNPVMDPLLNAATPQVFALSTDAAVWLWE